MLFAIVSTMLFIALMDEQRLLTDVETGENDIDRTSLFAIFIIVAQPC